MKTKQEKKEEGRRRALEISIAKQQNISNNNNDSKPGKNVGGDKRGNRKSARHGARNQHRHKQFARWILKTFPHVVEDCSDTNKQDEHTPCKVDMPIDECTQTQKLHILDVAGGKGELSARLSLCHSIRVVMIDPRPADIESVYMNDVVPKLPNKWQTSIKDRLKQTPSFVHDELDERFTQLIMPFTSPSTDEQECHYNDVDLDEAVRNASLIIGLHADGATEAIVDAALLYNKPFVVVPCCVFPNLFHQRYITITLDNATDDRNSIEGEVLVSKEKRIPVRTHDQFCEYLLAKDPHFKKEVLPFEGRNVAIWWDGK